ncbi:hypothetical protein [Streptomyces clavuligerus]|uniref:hypothetical protein n=1 Tax=Streptomyces clavuligerus TaxID=1901 RepID=UPI0001851F1E|nr:hypothetical protein [Streptomyces clavuligerus]MBY6306598.1 hypothetical protein [Streptomyces clavuligerus]QCS10795.1 hypothetical protein CRV15_35370 [Streptomyces clavuligerus]QPJ97170.1 hypothetical protein GE265_29115 [Streptomyces clavuligerus]WDN57501.1 hypothetical protein LL058_37710 [Streptomyces clavuligerus]
MSRWLSVMRTRYGGRPVAALLMALLGVTTLSTATTATAAPQAPAAAPSCVKALRTIAATGGDIRLCQLTGQKGLYLSFVNTGRLARDLSAVVYDCQGKSGTDQSEALCRKSIRGTYDIIWRQVEPGETAEVTLPKLAPQSHLYWTQDAPTAATNLKWEKAAWMY